jgi:hypothetical protein
MTTRITEKDLQAVCARINRTCGTPLAPYSKAADGTFGPNANAYLIDYAYGGASLHQMSGTPGCTGERDVLGCGHITKRDLYERMHAFLRGIDAARGE